MTCHIDLIVEKYLTGYMRGGGHMTDIFENPNTKEMRELGRTFRFIADAKRKKIYIFEQGNMHSRVWKELKKVLNDSRDMYMVDSLFGGTIENGKVMNWGFEDGMYPLPVIEEWATQPDMFDFANKWVDISGWMKKNMDWMIRKSDKGNRRG